ncbi:MAG: hypothetical protein NTV25_07160 [Methanothrix sp.]|nr:hypothetical protein [Methanothrix sp.]
MFEKVKSIDFADGPAPPGDGPASACERGRVPVSGRRPAAGSARGPVPVGPCCSWRSGSSGPLGIGWWQISAAGAGRADSDRSRSWRRNRRLGAGARASHFLQGCSPVDP